MTLDKIHTPVMLNRCIDLLAPALSRPGAVVIDATLGMAGHSLAMLTRFPELRLIGLDRDPEALAIASERLAPVADRAHLVHTVYDGIEYAMDDAGVDHVDGILFDLGVSSLQLDKADRGFSYSQADAPLDMRMDSTSELTAEHILATYGEGNMRRIFEDFGEEKLAGRYARAIIAARQLAPITRSGQLVQILQDATPAAISKQGHPAKRVFQALRIEVNTELSVLEKAIPAGLDALGEHGRMVVLSYQSLEDRIVKKNFAKATTSTTPPGLPMELPEHAARFKLLVRGAELATEQEIDENPRAKPVRLRAVERVRIGRR